MQNAHLAKRLRGVLKQFLPYGLQRRYMWRTYHMVEPWDTPSRRSFAGVVRNILPYGLVRAWLKSRYERKVANGRYRDGVPDRAIALKPDKVARRILQFQYKPRVSVIVASYNYEKFIGDTLDSLLAQTYGNFEVIVVDDGSSDQSVSVIQKYAGAHPEISLYRHEGGVNRGLPETLKLGVAKATGEYVAFCESDDVWTPDHLEEKIALLNRYGGKPKVIINDILAFGDEGRCRAANGAMAERMAFFSKERNAVSPVQFRKKNWICTFSCCMVARSELEVCDFDACPRPANLDWWLWRQICCVNDIYVVHAKLTLWRMHDSFMVTESVRDFIRQRDFTGRMDHLLLEKFPDAAKELSLIVKEHDRLAFVAGKLLIDGREPARPPAFSVVMPTFNRGFCICTAIDSLLRQSYQRFELVIVDDGSTDGTDKLVEGTYAEEIASGKIKYIRSEKGGVSRARNRGLAHASNEWIAYLDSDNELCDHFLETFTRAIVQNPFRKNFYAKLVCGNTRRLVGREFDFKELVRYNYIDLGVYVHHRDLIAEIGGFDENMKRLVDWDLIVRQTEAHEPCFLDEVVLVYNNESDYERITTSVSLKPNMDYFRRKHNSSGSPMTGCHRAPDGETEYDKGANS